jgi:Mrp family chromosome partitioning ATPase
MEKLQAALDKARKQREEKSGGDPAPAPATPGPRRSRTGLDDLWEALPSFEIDKSQLDEHHLVSGSPTVMATHFDVLRTKVLLQMRQNGWKRLAITSPMPRSGKTTTACNLAMGLGRQRELRTMLMDMDLRSPSIGSFFQVTPEYSISDVLAGDVDFADQAMRWGNNVACSMANRAEADPARVLLAADTTQKLEEIEARYQPDITIFDMPSVLVNDDTRAFLKNVDCALIIIRANETRYTQFDTCEREIAAYTNVLGVMLNAYTTSKTIIPQE